MSILDDIRETLTRLTLDPDVPMCDVWYGACQAADLEHWNYFVFNRKKTTKSSNRKDFQTFYQIHIIHEDYIPEGYVQKVIEELESKGGDTKLRCTEDDIEYNYTFKGNTNMVIETATITVFRPEKRCK